MISIKNAIKKLDVYDLFMHFLTFCISEHRAVYFTTPNKTIFPPKCFIQRIEHTMKSFGNSFQKKERQLYFECFSAAFIGRYMPHMMQKMELSKLNFFSLVMFVLYSISPKAVYRESFPSSKLLFLVAHYCRHMRIFSPMFCSMHALKYPCWILFFFKRLKRY